MSLELALARIRMALIEESSAQPGQRRISGRPHEYARARTVLRYSRSGQLIDGKVRLPAECPRPVHGRCDCPPDGNWRPIAGAIQADAAANRATFMVSSHVRNAEGRLPGIWTDNVYELASDGFWHCVRPMRRALERLRGESRRNHATLAALLLGRHTEGTRSVEYLLRIIRRVERWAEEEAWAEWTKPPRRWKALPWTERSESQQNAEMA